MGATRPVGMEWAELGREGQEMRWGGDGQAGHAGPKSQGKGFGVQRRAFRGPEQSSGII